MPQTTLQLMAAIGSAKSTARTNRVGWLHTSHLQYKTRSLDSIVWN